MTSLQQELENIGLTPNQSQIYLVLFELREAKAGQIIKKIGLHRNLVYTGLDKLEEKKLIGSYFNRGVKTYKMLTPIKLLDEVQQKEQIAKKLIGELSALGNRGNQQEITVYEGIDEFRRHVLNSYASARPGDLVRYLGISSNWYKIIGPSLAEDLLKIQLQKKIRMQGLAAIISQEDREFLKAAKGLAEVKLNSLISDDTSGTEIYGDRISIRSFIEPYFVVEIRHEQLAKNYQNYFDFLWKQKVSRSKK